MKSNQSSSPSFSLDEATLDRAARAVATVESWDGWDTNTPTPNGNAPEEQRTWCRESEFMTFVSSLLP